MNAELQRQHDEHKARQARISGGRPICRAVAAPVMREPPTRPRRSSPRIKPLQVEEAIEREHQTRIRCVKEAYQAERDRHRAAFQNTMYGVNKREMEDLAECGRYRSDLIAEARSNDQ